MSDLSNTLVKGLIDEAFKNLSREERLAFVQRMFAELPAESQERLLRTVVHDLAVPASRPHGSSPTLRVRSGPPLSGEGRAEPPPADIGPWRACCRMMTEVDRASQFGAMDAARPARVFGALADETRIRIIKLLSQGEERVDDLTRSLEVPQSTVSHHLRVLKEAGLVRAEKRGRSIYYSIAGLEE